MKCPYCGDEESKVIDSRPTEDGERIRRRRECLRCRMRFTTYEVVETVPLIVIKKDNSREPFDRQKLLNAMLRACAKRPVSYDALERAVSSIEQSLMSSYDREVSSVRIGELTMQELKKIDEVAYVRFASVYQQFADVESFFTELKKLMDKYQLPVKIRFCDTMGYGVPYPGATLPRSVGGIIYGVNHFAQIPSELLEWHGHNDFYKAVVNSTTAWLYGCSSVNCSLLGIGERTGNTPLEAMVMEYASLRGTLDGMDPTVITEIAEFYEKELGYKIPSRTPFVGRDFNVTRAGIHADGVAKDEEIYNIFNTAKLLNRPLSVEVNKNSGLAGVAYWLNQTLHLEGESKISKNDPRTAILKEWVDKQYSDGRMTFISEEEMEAATCALLPELAKQAGLL